MGAARLFMLTDIEGVLDGEGNLVSEMTASEAREGIRGETITGGMIPKVETCVEAVENSVDGAIILDGRVPHAILLEVFTEHGVGTLIRSERKPSGA